MVSIRRAEPADADAIRYVARESWHAAYDDFLGPETVEATVEAWYDRDRLREEIATVDAHVFVATEAGADRRADVVGFVHAAPGEGSSAARLHRLYVLPAQWRAGIGRRLLERTETALEREGVGRLTLEVFAANEVGVAFYETTGFDRVGTAEEVLGGTRHEIVAYEKAL